MNKSNTTEEKKVKGFMESKYTRLFLKKYKANYLLGISFLIIIDIMQTRIPIITGYVIDGLELKNIEMANIRHQIILLFFIAISVFIGRIIWRYFIFGTSRTIERDIRNDLFEHLEKMSTKYYQEHSAGEIMAHMTNDLEAVRMALGQGILFICDVAALGTITIFNMINEIDLVLTIVAVIPLLMIAITTTILGKELHKRFAMKQEAFADLSNFVQENLSGIKVIKSFVQEKKEIEAFEKVNKNNYNKNMKLMRMYTVMHPYMQFISGLSLAIAIGYGGYITVYGRISVGDFAAFIQYLGMLVWPMIAVGMTINIFTMGSASLERIEKILNEPIEIKDSIYVNHTNNLKGSIEVRNLSYKYPETNNYVLKDVSFKISKGQTLGIIGRTGSGKTTLVNLFLRIFDPDKNSIFIGGEDIMEIHLDVLRKNIGYVPQDNFLFSNTISNNIDFGVRNSTEDEIINAAKAACVHDNIIDFKEGYKTVIGERGVSLSGGQKQRISIARALIKDPEILILDDSVSAVDTDTEEKILSHIKNTRNGKTNVIIAHRISTIQNADLIIVIEDGKIIEKGKHAELIQNNGLYNSIYEKQLLEKMLEEQE